MSIEKALFSILKQELHENKGNSCAYVTIDKELFMNLLPIAEKHDVAHILSSAYSKTMSDETDELSAKCLDKVIMALCRREQKKYALSEISEVFKRLQIAYVPLKGSVICHYYPEEWMRSSCDVDILIEKKDINKALAGLEEIGYKVQKSTSIHDYSLFSPAGVHLELHFSLIQEECLKKANDILETAWEYTLEDPEHPYRRKLTNEMFVFYHIAHMAKHFIKGGCGIRPFMDLWIIKNKIDIANEILENLLERSNLIEFYRAVSDVINVWFETGTHSSLTMKIEEYILRGGVYGTKSNEVTISVAVGESHSKSFFKLMFMSRESLAILYPKLERNPKLYPFYQIKRWFRIFNKDKRNKIKHLADMRSSVSKSEINSTEELLIHIGLNEGAKNTN